MYKVLNLYACLGGNRLLWDNCDVTAVELDPELARLYSERFPNDTVIIADAHEYLLQHYKEFDFIWSSPPCPTHSKARFWGSKGGQGEGDTYKYQPLGNIYFYRAWPNEYRLLKIEMCLYRKNHPFLSLFRLVS